MLAGELVEADERTIFLALVAGQDSAPAVMSAIDFGLHDILEYRQVVVVALEPRQQG